MKKTISTVSSFLAKNWPHFAVAAVAVAAVFEPSVAHANSGLASSVNALGSNTVGLPKLITLGAYTVGTGSIVAGGLKLKAHADNPGNTPISHGLTRLLVGGTMMATPAVGAKVLESTGVNNTGGTAWNSTATGTTTF